MNDLATQSGDPDDVTLADEHEPRCTLESSMSGTCYCTGRPGCQGGGDDD